MGKSQDVCYRSMEKNSIELAKERSQRITVDRAEQQFLDADRSLRRKRTVWASMTILFFASLMIILGWLLAHPPELIQDVTKSAPRTPENKIRFTSRVRSCFF